MSLKFQCIRAQDIVWRESFHRYIQEVFPRVSFRRWCELDGWTPDYQAFALIEGEEIVANASVQRMKLILEGQELTGWQLGAVGTIPRWRGRGLQRQILGQVIETIGSQELIFLFANENVLGFYPKFGFKPIGERFFHASLDITQGATLPLLDLERPEDRECLIQIAASAEPVTRRFGARDYGNVLLWYWTNFYRHSFYHSQNPEAVVVAKQKGDLLSIADILSASPIELTTFLPRLVDRFIRQIEFGFTPERSWPDAVPSRANDESPLFVHGSIPMPQQAFKFPVLART